MHLLIKTALLIIICCDLFGGEIVGYHAVRRDTGEVLLSENADLSLVPSSCIKVVTVGAALRLLDPKERFETHLEYDGWIDEYKTLHGNLYIRGGGDPCLGSERLSGSLPWKEQIGLFADAVEKIGIRSIKGDIIGDATLWEKAGAAPSWCWEDLGNYYGAGASALSFHENAYTASFRPGKELGDQTELLRTEPPIFNLLIHNEVTSGPEGSGDRAWIFGTEYSPVQFMRGTIPLGVEAFSIKGAIPDPANVCADLLSKELEERGIRIEGETIQGGKRVSFHVTYSPIIGEIAHVVNQNSMNLYAEHLVKKIGEKVSGEGSTRAGTEAIKTFWRSQNIDLCGWNIVDGSGLSRKNLMTARQSVALLLNMEKSDQFSRFYLSLPQMEGSMRAKSGTQSMIKGYVGYTDHIAFAIFVNHCTDPKALKSTIDGFFAQIHTLEMECAQPAKQSL